MRLTLRLLSSAIAKRPFYVTTPIFYVNAPPHIGHLYSAVVADAIQRFEKLISPDCNVIFSTGTDEHGTKIQQAALKANLSLPHYCDTVSNEYRQLFKDFDVEYTDFIRTTEERHTKAVTHFWNELLKNDYIYKAKYSGWYSVNDEAFVPETHIKEEIRDGEKIKVATDSGHPVEWTEESNYMFRMSAFRTHLQEWLRTDGVVTPAKYQKQLLDMLRNDTYFPDISVSRPSSRVHWAIRVPNDEEQSIYVWLDALINYLTVIGYPDDDAMKLRGRPWPADVHVIGKDILKFHGLYWPAFLMAARRPPPRRLLCHAHWTVDGSKMSKSRRNAVPPRRVPAPPAALRYLLLRGSTLPHDANYSETKLINIANSELADTLGNLASRCCGAALNPRQEFPALRRPHPRARPLRHALDRLPDACYEHYSNYEFYKVADAVMHCLHQANLFFETERPWELKNKAECQSELDAVLHITMETLRLCGIVLQPLVPGLAGRLLDRLAVAERGWRDLRPSWQAADAIHETRRIQGGKFVLFPRISKDKDNLHKKQASA
ncbi:methionine--tRNA ligase, mitochondrial [Bombyx mori]|uniref:Methionine--tRNA ligase, mitochondrial n=1 Tax=Bombyx mori TaxID=7091 RepID=A0A8R2M7H9_BOMMO|nr:methionine--tRNA ligase, mitochondrial [Bombyx mori]